MPRRSSSERLDAHRVGEQDYAGGQPRQYQEEREKIVPSFATAVTPPPFCSDADVRDTSDSQFSSYEIRQSDRSNHEREQPQPQFRHGQRRQCHLV